MNILAFDTAMAACSAAIVTDDGDGPVVRARIWEPRTRGHAEVLMAQVDHVMAEAGLAYDEISRIAVTTGPGTFTGVRIGVSAARGMALALGIEAVGVTTLEAVARDAHAHGLSRTQPVFVAFDARRGEIYSQCFDAAAGALCEPALLTPQTACAQAQRFGGPVVGTAAVLLGELSAPKTLDSRPDLPQQPDAVQVAIACIGRDPAGEMPEPLYLRAPDAKLPA